LTADRSHAGHKRDETDRPRGSYAQAMSPAMTPEALVRSATAQSAVPFVPEIRLATAADPYGLWDRTQREAPPFWAFPWAGGQGLARYVLDHPGVVRGRRVLDVASGSGLVAIAAAKAGAARVTAGDIDELAVAAIGVNAAANGVSGVVAARLLDFSAGWGETGDESDIGGDGEADGGAGVGGAEVVLAADVFYQRELAALALTFLSAAARSGADVLVGDPGRAFVPRAALTPLATQAIPVLSVLEDGQQKTVTVYRLGLPYG
jgi:predicted nicotinamide N-methyase